jgi:hypothetical protein
MGYLLLGIAALVAGLFLARRFTSANPAVMARQLRFIAGVLAMAGGAVLAVRGHAALGLFLGFIGWGLFMGRGVLPWGAGGWGGSGPASGSASRIATEHLDMELDHASGAIRGQVRKGLFAGRDVETLSPAELGQLWRDYSFRDPQSAQILEAYLDRRHPSWRDDLGGDEGASSGAAGGSRPGGGQAMTREDALEILGLPEGASADQIRSAHRELMKKVHPDRGGSTYLAAQINQAKDFLLGA